MYGGQIVEAGTLDDVFRKPTHPYTEKLLMASAPVDDLGVLSNGIPGQVLQMGEFPVGCRFHPRCEYSVSGLCDGEDIPLLRHGDREVRCVRAAELQLTGV
jgi:oligopeptide/dipeptide ABC transporter ATP-binding protein